MTDKKRPSKTTAKATKAMSEGVGVAGNSQTTKQKVSKVSKNAGSHQPEVKTPSPEVSAGIPQKSGTVGYKKPPVHTQFKPGNNANPGGKPAGARNRLQGDFMRELAEDFAEHGKNAIVACRIEKPDVYVKVIASLMPKEFEIKRPLEELSEDELVAGVAALQSYLATQGNGVGVANPTQRKQTH
jgi:hypothetical protein